MNYFCKACSPIVDDITCLNNIDCTLTGIPLGYPDNDPSQGGTTGVSLQQTVNGLIPGNTYILEFWVGGFGNCFVVIGMGSNAAIVRWTL